MPCPTPPTPSPFPHGVTRPQVKEEFVSEREDLTKRNIMDGDPFLASGSPSWRFNKPETEPYMPSQAPGGWRKGMCMRVCVVCARGWGKWVGRGTRRVLARAIASMGRATGCSQARQV